MDEHLSVSILRIEARAHRHAGRLEAPALLTARLSAADGDTGTEPLQLLVEDATVLVNAYRSAARIGPDSIDVQWAEVIGERWRAVLKVAGQLLGECLTGASRPAHDRGKAEELWEQLGPLIVRLDLPFTRGV